MRQRDLGNGIRRIVSNPLFQQWDKVRFGGLKGNLKLA